MILKKPASHVRRWRTLLAILSAAVIALITVPAGAAVSHEAILGSGSSWAANAVNLWVSDVSANGLEVAFTSSSSGLGRKDFGNSTTDFGDSDIGYQGKDPVTGETDLPCPQGTSTGCRSYAYLPVVAGGTSFPYNIVVAGQKIRNLRLSGPTLAKIFTGAITNWNDGAITKDNNGRQLPSLTIIPVTHSEASGSTYQFTAYLNAQEPSIWQPFLGHPFPTEYFPSNLPGGVQYNGSDNMMNFITSSHANGAIGYDEYSYALAKDFPVAKIANAAGYYTLPTQYNVAVALQQAQIDTTDVNDPSKYLTQKLGGVYSDTDPRTYPLSSYSYMVIPTGTAATGETRMDVGKRQTLADFLYYSICQGQSEVGGIGYSPLPLNLVQASFDQTAKLKQADAGVDLTKRDVTTCNNPTFVAGNLSANHLADIAPQPPACDQAGAGPCTDAGNTGTSGVPAAPAPAVSGAGGGPAPSPGVGPAIVIIGGRPSGGSSSGAKPGTTAKSGAKAAGASTAGNTPSNTNQNRPTTAPSNTVATRTNPDTGQPEAVTNADGSGSGTSGADSNIVAVPTELAARQQNLNSVLAPLAVIEMLCVLVLPPVFYFVILRRRRAQR